MGGGGGIRNSDVTNLNFFESYNFLFHSFLRLLRTYMPMTAKREVHRLSEYFIEGTVWVPPPPPPHTHTHTQNRFLFLLPIADLIHFLTVVANFNNLQTHPSEIIFNNNIMQNGISKIVKGWRFNQFLLKSRRLQPHYIDAGDIIQPGTEELLLSSRKVHPPVVRFGRKQDSLIVLRVFRVWADSNLNVPRRWPP